ncbi:MAG: DUF4301 family protein [Bacteroidales bacterium]|nr:DUF4301 family protein [Bacteroidales bacterium]
MFTNKDIDQINSKGIDISQINDQIENFKNGFPDIVLIAAATVKKGIKPNDNTGAEKLSKFFDEHSLENNIIKFVPASGAASRMFKHLHEFVDSGDYAEEYLKDQSFNSVYNFIDNIKNFAFYDDLKIVLQKNGFDIDHCIKSNDFKTVIEFLLLKKGLNYSSLPKGLLKFHKYQEYSRTPVEEHLVEGANLCRDENNTVRIHFTISPEHKENFLKHIEEVKVSYENKFNVNYNIEFSIQKPSTDTIAVDMENNPFRETNGTLVFRPGGHGALIKNLNNTKGEIVFIKNIDNVVPDKLKPTSFLYKKVIGGYLIKLQNQIDDHLKALENNKADDSKLMEIRNFTADELCIKIIHDFNNLTDKEKTEYLFKKLNRPLRVCGMVKNEGEPGGGPFFIRNTEGEESLQIIEAAQMDLSNQRQEEIVNNATHFNPVDLVCNIRNYKGEQFNLLNYIDPLTGLISTKSKDGKDLKAQELPGLWNGAMADWITVFVEVPLVTFNPVKTINDLLREQHHY